MCVIHTFDPDIGCGCDSKDEEEEDEDKGLQIISSHPLHSIENSTKQLSLNVWD